MDVKNLLSELSFGNRIAEQEIDSLSTYFVETEQWRQLKSGNVDIIYGPKGAGKSALYSLLVEKKNDFSDNGIFIIPAENPSGTTAFAEIKLDPPTSEHEFVGVWKLYLVCLIANKLRNFDVQNKKALELYTILEQAKILPKVISLKNVLLDVKNYVKKIVNAESIEGGLKIDPATGMPSGVSGKITFREPSQELLHAGLISVDSLLEKADLALQEIGVSVWLLLDRLDVAFEQNIELENNALRALFRVYLSMAPLKNISLKIFLRTDIWRNITDQGFREASHITRQLTITWERQSLLNLVVLRFLANKPICEYYNVNSSEVLSSVKAQEQFISRMLPDKVDTGKNPHTFDWMLSRTQDGTKLTAPRELIHLLSRLRDVQRGRLELGHDNPSGELLFDRAVFKEALKVVSEERLTKTLYAENNDLKIYIEKLEGEKTQQNPETLARIWGVDAKKAQEFADKLSNIGFFESRGNKRFPIYWVPFLYRDALDMIQGEAK